jgi:hypothetical protein
MGRANDPMYAFLLVMIAVLPSFAQSTVKKREGKKENPVIVCDHTCIAIIYVKVTDKNGKEVTSLRHDNFSIYEDGVIQQTDSMWRNDNYKAECKPARYQLSYVPVNESFDGKYRKIKVIVKTKDGRILRAQVFPKGYYAKPLTDDLKATSNCRST